MSKISYHSKRSLGPSYPNYSYSNYIGYSHPYKKNHNYFKPRQKYNIPLGNNYFDERNKNYIYHNNFNDNNFHHTFFSKKFIPNSSRYYPYFTEEKKIEEEIISEPEKEEPKEEILRINVNLENESKEMVIYKNDDIKAKVMEFCIENHIDKKMNDLLYKKINHSLDTLNNFTNNFSFNKDDVILLNKLKDIVGNNEQNNS